MKYKVRIFTHLDVVFQANYFYKSQNTNFLIFYSDKSFMDNGLVTSDGTKVLVQKIGLFHKTSENLQN
jgi:hypothetical protein